jgi:hypothetical protein
MLADLGDNLLDTPATFWPDAEKTLYIQEAIRTWNSLTSFWRDDFTMPTANGVTWYDISSTVTAPNTLRPRTITDVYLMTIMEYHLLEPPTGATWTGSNQFQVQDLLDSLAQYRDELLSSTACYINNRTPASGAGRTVLSDLTTYIRRVAWIPTVPQPTLGIVATPLWPDDQWELQSYERGYLSAPTGIPSTYRQSNEPPLTFETDIQPSVAGTYDILTVESGPALSLISPSTLPIPDDWTWVMKWGALGNVLSQEAVSKDILRMNYCLLRYRQGVEIMQKASAILSARIGNTLLDIDSVQDMDNFRPRWQAEALGTPDVMITTGLNLAGFSSIPNGVFTVTLNVVQNAPVPVIGTDQIQIARDDYNAVLGYAQHLAMFKVGGAEFQATIPLLQKFFEQASLYNSTLTELGEFQKDMYELAGRDFESHPVFDGVQPKGDVGGGEQ